MVSRPTTFDVSKYGEMADLTQTKHRFGILDEFTYIFTFGKESLLESKMNVSI